MALAARLILAALLLGAGFVAGAVAQQSRWPQFDIAQQHLTAALQQLEPMPQTFNGHRVRAIRHIRDAQKELGQAANLQR